MASTLFLLMAVILRIISNPLGNVFQKQLTEKGEHPLLVNFLTYLLLSCCCVFFIKHLNANSFPARFWTYSLIGGLLGAAGNGFLIKALQGGELSVLGPINAYKSIVGMLIGFFLLHEVPNGWGLMGVLIIIAGSYLVLDTTEEKFSWKIFTKPSIQYRIWALILTGMEAVTIKKVILASDVSTAFFSWCIFGALFSFILLKLYHIQWKPTWSGISISNGKNYLFLIICIGLMQFTTNYSFSHMPVGYALALFQLSTILSVFFGHHVFKEREIGKKIIGSVIMIIGSVLIIILKDH